MEQFASQRAVVQSACVMLISLISASCAHHYERWIPSTDRLRTNDKTAAELVVAKQVAFSTHSDAQAGKSIQPFYRSLRLAGSADSVCACSAQTARVNQWRQSVLFSDERAQIEADWRSPEIGLALSGGGVRSAAFAVGVLKGLDDLGVLQRVGYLSTVSGGGFAGGWYVTHINEPGLFDPGSRHLERVIQSGHYLNASNFSHSGSEKVKAMGWHVLGLPSVWIFNWLFDVQANWTSYIRSHYTYSISSSFLYDDINDPLSSDWLTYVRKKWDDSFYVYLADFVHSVAAITRLFYAPVDAVEATFGRCYGWAYSPTRIPGTLRGYSGISRYDSSFSSPRGPPFWIVNAHLSLTDDDGIATRARSGEPFEVTPLRAGSESVGYVTTRSDSIETYTVQSDSNNTYEGWKSLKSRNYDLTWQRTESLLAISAAAVDSESLRQGPVTSTLLKCFGLDLGVWINGWGSGWVSGDENVFFNNAVYALQAIAPVRWLWQLFEPTTHDQTTRAKSYLLTDGGHFDNTGLYALARRGCRLIIVADATAEPGIDEWSSMPPESRAQFFKDFREVAMKVRTDFGADVQLDLSSFDPRCGRNLVLDGKLSGLPIMRDSGQVSQDAEILYVKAAYKVADAVQGDAVLDGQDAELPAFPNVPTGEQWYDERLMSSMVHLGYRAVIDNGARFRRAVDQFKRTQSTR